MIHRREFIVGLGGVAAWPAVARGQQGERMRRVGVLMGTAADDPRAPGRVAAFAQGLAELGWTIGRNVQIDYRWAPGDANHRRGFAAELVALKPDAILANGGLSVAPLLQITRTVPVVFVEVTDPVGGGLVASLARPGGNATGFSTIEYSVSVKWLELLKEIAPGTTRAAALRNTTIAGVGQLGAIQGAASSLGVELRPIDPSDIGEMERTLTAFAREQDAGLIVTTGGLAPLHRDLIISLAAKLRLGIPTKPAIHSNIKPATYSNLKPAGVPI